MVMAIFCASSSMELSKRNHFRHHIVYQYWYDEIHLLVGRYMYAILATCTQKIERNWRSLPPELLCP